MCMCPLILSVEAANGFMRGFTVLQPLQDLSTVKKQEFAVLKDAPFFFYNEMHLSCGHCDKNMTILNQLRRTIIKLLQTQSKCNSYICANL